LSFLTELFIFLIAALAVVPLLNRLGLSSVIGYLVAGVIIGPGGAAVIDDPEEVLHFAEIGVVLLLFIIGLELQPRRLWVMRRAVFGLGTSQVLVTTLLLSLALWLLNQGLVSSLVLGFSLALSSTAFVLQLLGEKKQLNYAHGRAAFGTLLFQDVAVIPVIAYLSIISTENSEGRLNLLVIGGVIAALIVARFLLKPLLRLVASTGIHELFIAASLAIVTGAALAMDYAGLSMGLGAFIAGMMVADSEYRHQLETDVMPFKGLLLGLFFMAVGMSANLSLLIESPVSVILLTLGLVTIKAIAVVPLAILHGLDREHAMKTAIVLSQGGEFAFVLLTVAVGGGLISSANMELAVLVVTLSMATTPFLMIGLGKILDRDNSSPEFDQMPEDSKQPIIIAGFGRFGQIIGRVLTAQGFPFTALDIDPGQVDFVREFGSEVYYGDATRLDLLQNAGLRDARLLVIAIDNVETSVKLAEMMRESCPGVPILARARNRQHEIKLRDLGVNFVIREILLSSLDMAKQALLSLGMNEQSATNTMEAFKLHDVETLDRQAAVAHDENAYRQTSMDAAEELRQLFSDDIALIATSFLASAPNHISSQLLSFAISSSLRINAVPTPCCRKLLQVSTSSI
jgi:glutathione-regulated potassium-efflux system ancillary protein KefC/glutathione-regulated potassium-efflux system protein KefB